MRLMDRPGVRAQFTETLNEVEAPTPWITREGDPGCVFTRDGDEIAVVDQNNYRTDKEAHRLAVLICMAVNACAMRANEPEVAS